MVPIVVILILVMAAHVHAETLELFDRNLLREAARERLHVFNVPPPAESFLSLLRGIKRPDVIDSLEFDSDYLSVFRPPPYRNGAFHPHIEFYALIDEARHLHVTTADSEHERDERLDHKFVVRKHIMVGDGFAHFRAVFTEDRKISTPVRAHTQFGFFLHLFPSITIGNRELSVGINTAYDFERKWVVFLGLRWPG